MHDTDMLHLAGVLLSNRTDIAVDDLPKQVFDLYFMLLNERNSRREQWLKYVSDIRRQQFEK